MEDNEEDVEVFDKANEQIQKIRDYINEITGDKSNFTQQMTYFSVANLLDLVDGVNAMWLNLRGVRRRVHEIAVEMKRSNDLLEQLLEAVRTMKQ